MKRSWSSRSGRTVDGLTLAQLHVPRSATFATCGVERLFDSYQAIPTRPSGVAPDPGEESSSRPVVRSTGLPQCSPPSALAAKKRSDSVGSWIDPR